MSELIILKTIDYDIAIAIAWAGYWNAMAVTGAAKQRNITRGDGHVLTPEELTKEALDTSTRHLHHATELADKKKELICKLYKEIQEKTGEIPLHTLIDLKV
jgi:hypothetical protein